MTDRDTEPGELGSDDAALALLLRAHFTAPGDAAAAALGDLARVQAGEADEATRARAEAVLARDPEAAEALRWLEESAPESAGGRRPRRSRWPIAVAAVALATAAAVALVIVPSLRGPETRPAELGVKGTGDELHVAVRRGARTERIASEDRLGTGDEIGLFYSAERAGFLAVLHVDERSTTPLFAAPDGGTRPIEAGRERSLPAGGVMTDGEGCEWFVAVFADAALDAAVIERGLARAERRSSCGLELTVEGARSVRVVGVRR